MKKRILFLLTLLGFGILTEAQACMCSFKPWSPALVEEYFYFHDLIIIGEPIFNKATKNSGENYSLKVLEVIKGQVKNDTIYGKLRTSCSGFPHSKGSWIIYSPSKHENNDTIDFSECGLSRNITTFINFPPRINIKLDSVTLATKKQEWQEEYRIIKQLVHDEEERIASAKSVSLLTCSAAGLVLLISILLLINNHFKKLKRTL
ncbi:hypothetical protein [Rufibacter roseus]|uniref:Tissue inhibitor of metalloproteinase n=1 Tax=Rufibacter roseus TaxID=1567108 RepID=A0ABW2DH56_9BACT|nr:hypothetical protein [Rufibacter roseus]